MDISVTFSVGNSWDLVVFNQRPIIILTNNNYKRHEKNKWDLCYKKLKNLAPSPPSTHLYTYSKMHKQVHAVISTHSHMHAHAMFYYFSITFFSLCNDLLQKYTYSSTSPNKLAKLLCLLCCIKNHKNTETYPKYVANNRNNNNFKKDKLKCESLLHLLYLHLF